MKLAGLFPGQGSQSVGMGKSFFEQSEECKELYQQADEVLGFSLSDISFNGPIEELTLTQNAQPAILVASYVAYVESGVTLTVAAGHSLGEYTALVAAGAIMFADAVQLVHNRGRYMQEAVAEGEGKMIAVMGPAEEEITGAIEQLQGGVAEVANLNCPGQTVVAGDVEGVDALSKALSQSGAKVIPLNVSAPFHCSLMRPAAEKLALDLANVSFSDLAFPIIANVSAELVSTGSEAKELLKQQVCGTVRWTDSIQNIASANLAERFVEFGGGGVLSKLVKRIDKSLERTEVGSVQAAHALRAEIEAE